MSDPQGRIPSTPSGVSALPSHLLGPPAITVRHRGGPVPSEIEMRAVAERLFARYDPTIPSSVFALTTRRLPPVYPAGVIRPLDMRLAATVTNHGRLFLQGQRTGVGASKLMANYANAFNQRAKELRDPRRIGVVQIVAEMHSPVKMLDALCTYLGAPLRTTEIRFRSIKTLADRFIAAMQERRVCTLIFDHIHNASPAVLNLIAELALASDPSYRVPLDDDGCDVVLPRLGIILVTHVPPEIALARAPALLQCLEGEYVEMSPYQSPVDVADALRQFGVGLDDLDLTSMDDALMAQLIYEFTQGLIELIEPLVRIIDAVTYRSDLQRPTLETVLAALPYHRRLRQEILKRRDPPLEGKSWNTLWNRAAALSVAGGDEVIRRRRRRRDGEPDPSSTKRLQKGRAAKLREVRENRGIADDERKKKVAAPRRRKKG